MKTKQLVKILRKWHVCDGELYCPQCWGKYLSQFSSDLIEIIKGDSGDGNLKWVRERPECCMCKCMAWKE